MRKNVAIMKNLLYKVETISELHEIPGFEIPQNFSRLFSRSLIRV
jgi:hypothetical protein